MKEILYSRIGSKPRSRTILSCRSWTTPSGTNAWKRELLRMPPMDLSDVAYDRFLADGESEHHIAAKANEAVRPGLWMPHRSSFLLQCAGGPLTIVSADGQDVVPGEEGSVPGFFTSYPVNWWLLRAGIREKK